MHTKESLAAILDGREYGKETNGLPFAEIKASGLLIVYGASDDLVEFGGLFRDECGASSKTEIIFDRSGIIPAWEEYANGEQDEDDMRGYFKRKDSAQKLTAYWCRTKGGPAWEFETTLPHSTFAIKEDGEMFCLGIVIDMK